MMLLQDLDCMDSYLDRLEERVKRRNRPAEKNLTRIYLTRITKLYHEWANSVQAANNDSVLFYFEEDN